MTNFQFNCEQCGFISRLCRHEVEELSKAKSLADQYRTALEEIHFMRSELGEIPGGAPVDAEAVAMRMANTAHAAIGGQSKQDSEVTNGKS